MQVNGINALGKLDALGNFTVKLPWSSKPTKKVCVKAVDDNGVSQTSTFATVQIGTVIGTRAGASLSAAGAHGRVIAKLRLQTGSLAATGRLGVAVTVKDRRGLLVRGASVRLQGMPQAHLASSAVRVGFTDRVGQAGFTYLVSRAALTGKGRCARGLKIVVRAATPNAKAHASARLRLPIAARS